MVARAGAGLGPDGCGSQAEDNGKLFTLLDVSLSFVCSSTGDTITPSSKVEFQVEGGLGKFRVELSDTEAPANCNTIYWDPKITPILSTEGTNPPDQGTTSGSSSESDATDWMAIGLAAGGAVVFLAVALVVWHYRRHRVKTAGTPKPSAQAKNDVV